MDFTYGIGGQKKVELNNIPDIFSNKLRLAILAALVMEPKTFRDLKEITLATDGNLGGQLNKLEECGAIIINKEFVKRKPQTTYELTDAGRAAFKEYVDLLDRIISKSEADKK